MIKGMTCLARKLEDLLLQDTRAPQRRRNLHERTNPTQKQAQVKAKRTSKKTYKNQHKNLEGWRRSNELLGGGPENGLKELGSLQMRKKVKGSVVQAYKAWAVKSSRTHVFKVKWRRGWQLVKEKTIEKYGYCRKDSIKSDISAFNAPQRHLMRRSNGSAENAHTGLTHGTHVVQRVLLADPQRWSLQKD